MAKKYLISAVRFAFLALVSILLVSCFGACGCDRPTNPFITGSYIPWYSGTFKAVIIDANGTILPPDTITTDDDSYTIHNIDFSKAPYLIQVKLDNGKIFYTTALKDQAHSHSTVRDVSNLSTLALVLASYPYVTEFNNLKSILHKWPVLATKLNADLIDHASKVIYANLQTYYTEEGLLPDSYNVFYNDEWDRDNLRIIKVISRSQISYDFTQTMPTGITVKVDGNIIPFDPYINVDAIDFTYQCTLKRQENGECDP